MCVSLKKSKIEFLNPKEYESRVDSSVPLTHHESTLEVDSAVPLTYRDPKDSWIHLPRNAKYVFGFFRTIYPTT